jgi:hypothetical protein
VTTTAFLLAPAFTGYKYNDREVGHYAAILCLAGVFEVVRGLAVVALQGTRQMREFAWFDITSSTVRLGLVFVALLGGYGVPGVVWAFFVHMVVSGRHRALVLPARAARRPARRSAAAVGGARRHARRVDAQHLRHQLPHGAEQGHELARAARGRAADPGMKALQSTGQAFATGAAYKIGYVLAWGWAWR